MEEEDDEFLFESAHLALRSNSDYQKLMRHLAILCAQRIRVHEDIKQLNTARVKANDDPLSFVEELKQGSLNLPSRNTIPEVTSSFYNIDFNKSSSIQIPTLDMKLDTISSREETKKDTRSLDGEKSQSTNFWTADEQRKLEKLLHEFPTEAIESQRFIKISKALGTRTPKQVASRVQKFFKKLNDANLPIPGSSHCPGRRKASRNNFKIDRPTTFFPERNLSTDLLMKNSDDETENTTTESFADRKNKDQSKVLILLKQVREVKSKTFSSQGESSGKKCCKCNEELYTRSSFHCNDCFEKSDYCADCITSELIKSTFVHLNHDVTLS